LIKFTCEEEVDGSLLFLDVPTLSVASLSRQVISMNTKWMPSHVAPGLCNLPFSRENFEKDVAYIKETAGLNGYTVKTSFQMYQGSHHIVTHQQSGYN
jgi:hypothetical protein